MLESFLILALGRRNDPLNPGPLWNLTNGGEGASGYVCSEETRLKISIGKRGTKLTEATKQKIAEQHRGMKATEETRRGNGNSSKRQTARTGVVQCRYRRQEPALFQNSDPVA